jgi:putative redox protein
MADTVVTKWIGDLSFDSLVSGHHVTLDSDSQYGGHDAGPRPKALLLTALTGCSGMDIVSILNKMKVEDYSLMMEATGIQTEEHPKHYHTITVSFKFAGKNLPEDKIVKAVKLSYEKYCGVSEMLRQSAKIIIKVFINDSEVAI